ncbi:MAG: ABC transporter substrate-binding protein [Streptosporangiales bacterium]|nr:ABC transporter substrate-binding protein [Streptosporangiales bacterium]MBO0891124.1 ABC transporter substrate-binding protein [Acidothermales bacterium]
MRGLVRSTYAVSILVVLAMLAAAGCAHKAAKTENGQRVVRFASVGGLTDAGVYIAQAKGYFKDAGIKVERQRMGSGSEITTAIASGNLDVAGMAVTAGMFNSVSQGLGIQIVGDKQSVSTQASATRLLAQKSLVKGDEKSTLENLKGKKVAVTDSKNATLVMFDTLMKKYGMSSKDVQVETMTYPEMSAALIKGSIDAGVIIEPFLTAALASGKVADVDDLSGTVPPGGASIVPLIYSQDFIKDRAVAQKFMTAYMKGVRLYNDAFFKHKDTQAIAQIIAKASGQTVQTVLKTKPFGLQPDQQVNTQFLEEQQNWFAANGLVKKKVAIGDLVDDSFAKQSVQKLGKY